VDLTFPEIEQASMGSVGAQSRIASEPQESAFFRGFEIFLSSTPSLMSIPRKWDFLRKNKG
jgi:hypothetical protein